MTQLIMLHPPNGNCDLIAKKQGNGAQTDNTVDHRCCGLEDYVM